MISKIEAVSLINDLGIKVGVQNRIFSSTRRNAEKVKTEFAAVIRWETAKPTNKIRAKTGLLIEQLEHQLISN